MRHIQSLQFWYITAGKPEILLKTKISAKTLSLGISNNASHRSHNDHRVPVKLRRKILLFDPKLGLNCPPGATLKGHQKFSHSL